MSDDIIRTIMQGKRSAATAASSSRIGKPYRPGSGTEGAAFDDAWCANCARDLAFRETEYAEDGCSILADVLAFEIDHPKFPKEWVYGHDGRPCCTAFTSNPDKPLRCDKTLDMFGQQSNHQGE